MPAAPRLLDSRGNALAPRNGVAHAPQRRLAARYDAAELSPDTRRHWAEADALSAKAANSIQVRHRLRTRARYEVANNSYARGMVETLANDVIGTGPRLQMLTPDADANRAIETAFADWGECVGLPEKLRTVRKARTGDGEAFAVMATNPKLDSPVKLDLRLYEADQVATPLYFPFDPLATDGIRYDEYNNPIEYHLLKYHPGDTVHLAPYGAFDRIDADLMIHWFRVDRPGQLRGVPEITPALPLYAQLRRYTLAVIAGAETAADLAAVIQSTMPANGEAQACEPFDAVEIERRMMTTLPAGWTMGQFKPEQPSTNYEMFKHEIINEIARCLNMPFNVAAGNSSGYNYSSGRLDQQTFLMSIKVDRSHCGRVVLDPVLYEWLGEAGRTVEGVPRYLTYRPHRWLWGGMEHVDPEKEANAQAKLLANGMTSFSEECQKQGVDPEARAATIAADQERFRRLGVNVPWATHGSGRDARARAEEVDRAARRNRRCY